MTDVPTTQYAKRPDGAYVAYQVVGAGPVDLVFMENWGSHVESAWEVPARRRFYLGLASFSRLIRYDMRGSGLSDPLEPFEPPTLEGPTADLVAVLNAAGSERPAIVANNLSGLLAIFFAATYPHRTGSLVLDGCYARLARAPDYRWGVPRELLQQALDRVPDSVAGRDLVQLEYTAPTAVRDDPEFVETYLRNGRSVFSPREARAMVELAVLGDVRPLLSAIQAPTLVMYRADDQFAGRPHAAYLAQHIDGAKLVELSGRDNLCLVGPVDVALEEVQEFLTGARGGAASIRVLATLVFTDIVGSTEHAASLGDTRWRELLDRHDRAIRRQLERFDGHEVNTAGDGFLATFDGPGRAIHCANAIRDAVAALGMEVRVGVHTGEIERRGIDIAGLAVHIGSRVAHLAGAGEVLVSSTVKDLVVGSGIAFDERGTHELKGVPGTWTVFVVRP